MKTITKIVSIMVLGFIFMNSNYIVAQDCPRDKPVIKEGPVIIDPGNSTILEVPLELRSKLKLSDLNENNSYTVLTPIKELGGCMSVIFDKDKKVVEIRIPENSTIPKDYLLTGTTEGRESPYRRCEEAGSDWGTALCVANVISETILSWFD